MSVRFYFKYLLLFNFSGRLMPRTLQNPANYNVMGDTVIIQIFGEKPTIMEIRDEAVAESYLKFFEEMWDVSRAVKV